MSCFICFQAGSGDFVSHQITICERLLFKLLDSCVFLPGLIISGGGPFQWNAVGHQLLDLSLNAVQNSWIGVSQVKRASNDECDMFTHKHHVRFFPYVDFPSHRVFVCGADLGDSH